MLWGSDPPLPWWRCSHQLHPIRNQAAELWCLQRAVRYRPWAPLFSSTLCCSANGSCDIRPRNGTRSFPCGAVSTKPVNWKLVSGTEVFTTCGAVSTWRVAALVPGLLDYKMHRLAFDSWKPNVPVWCWLIVALRLAEMASSHWNSIV